MSPSSFGRSITGRSAAVAARSPEVSVGGPVGGSGREHQAVRSLPAQPGKSARARALAREPLVGRILILGALVLVGAAVRPAFASLHSIDSILLSVAPLAAMATGEAFVMIRGKLVDMSAGVVASICAVTTVVLSPHGTAVAVAAGLGLGVLIGAVSGTAVGVFRGNPIIVTLGMSSIVGAIDLGFTGGKTETLSSGLLARMGSATLGSIPMPVVVCVVVIAVTSVWFARSRVARVLKLSGDSESAIVHSAQGTVWSTVLAFALMGLFSAFGGVLLASYVGNLDFSVAASSTLPAIAGAVIGGVSLFGGEGTVWQAAIGSVILGFLTSVLLVLGFSPYQEEIVEGLLVVLVVFGSDRLSARRA